MDSIFMRLNSSKRATIVPIDVKKKRGRCTVLLPEWPTERGGIGLMPQPIPWASLCQIKEYRAVIYNCCAAN